MSDYPAEISLANEIATVLNGAEPVVQEMSLILWRKAGARKPDDCPNDGTWLADLIVTGLQLDDLDRMLADDLKDPAFAAAYEAAKERSTALFDPLNSERTRLAADLAAAVAARDDAQARNAAALALHVRDGVFCDHDGFPWPCLTVRALTQPTDSGGNHG